MGKSTELGVSFRSSKTKIVPVGRRGWYEIFWKKAELESHEEEIDEIGRTWTTSTIFWPRVFGMHWTWMQAERTYHRRIQKNVRIANFCGSNRKLPGWENSRAKTVAWSYDREGHAKKCVERHCQRASKKIEQLYQVSTFCMDDQSFKKLETVGELSNACSQIVLECLYLARIGGLDILFVCEKTCSSSHNNGQELEADV